MELKYYPPDLCDNPSIEINKLFMSPTKTNISRQDWLEPNEIINTSSKHQPTNNLDSIKIITNTMMVIIGCIILTTLIIFCPPEYVIGIFCVGGILYKIN